MTKANLKNFNENGKIFYVFYEEIKINCGYQQRTLTKSVKKKGDLHYEKKSGFSVNDSNACSINDSMRIRRIWGFQEIRKKSKLWLRGSKQG